MLILSTTIFFILNSNFESIVNVEIPIVFIAGEIGIISKYVFGIYLLIAILTTALSSGYAFLSNTSNNRKSLYKMSLIICSISILFGQLEFSKLIGNLYPIFGLLGIMQIIFLLTA